MIYVWMYYFVETFIFLHLLNMNFTEVQDILLLVISFLIRNCIVFLYESCWLVRYSGNRKLCFIEY